MRRQGRRLLLMPGTRFSTFSLHRVFLRYQKYEADAAMRARDSLAQHDLSLGRRERVGPRANDVGTRSGAKTFVETKRKTASRRSFDIVLCFDDRSIATGHWQIEALFFEFFPYPFKLLV